MYRESLKNIGIGASMDNGFVELEIREGETRLYNWKLNMFT
jgi:hypothetical protein